MRANRRRLILTVAFTAVLPLVGPAAQMQQAAAAKRPIELEDIVAWKAIGATAISNDGQWFAYRFAPGEGDAQVILKRIRGDKELKFDIGDPQAATIGAPPPPPGPPAAPPSSTLDFSED